MRPLSESDARERYQRALEIMQQPSPDTRQALPLLQAAADARLPDAMYALGTWYLHGRDGVVDTDVGRATELIQSAAEAGYPSAMYDLAVSYEKGYGLPHHPERAFEWFLRA